MLDAVTTVLELIATAACIAVFVALAWILTPAPWCWPAAFAALAVAASASSEFTHRRGKGGATR